MPSSAPLHAPATLRNRDPILDVLQRTLPAAGTVLEVGSGSGEHAVWFARHLPQLGWQPSDCNPELIESIAAWRARAGLDNLNEPLNLDTTHDDWSTNSALARLATVAVLAINLTHITPWSACEGLMRGAAHLLGTGGMLYLYGAFRIGGIHTSPSNQAFDQMLQAHNPDWGVRDLHEVAAVAEVHGFDHVETIAMPSNNLSVIFRRRG